jgi:NAD(P)H dehydrogenase (quinone)
MILITGAAGKTGQTVIRALSQRQEPVRAYIRHTSQAEKLAGCGVGEFAVGDLRDAAALRRAMLGIRAVYHICPNMQPDETDIGRLAIAAAREARVERFVYHSVLHPQIEDMPHHWAKLRVEEQLFMSGLPYTILQPAAYIQNILAYWPAITHEGLYSLPYAEETRLGMVDLEDVAAAAAIVLCDSGHTGAVYELAGEEILSQREAAAILSEVLGRPVRVNAIPLADWKKSARSSGMGDYALETLSKMFSYYEKYGFWGNSRVLNSLLGRRPASFRSFLNRTIGPVKESGQE